MLIRTQEPTVWVTVLLGFGGQTATTRHFVAPGILGAHVHRFVEAQDQAQSPATYAGPEGPTEPYIGHVRSLH